MTKLYALLIPLVLGAFTVLQAGLNRRIALRVGLPSAVLLNACWLAIAASTFYLLTFKGGAAQKLLEIPRTFSWWYLLPGLMGLGLIWGLPMAIKNGGAQSTFVLLVSAQLLASILWDWRVEGLTIPPAKIIGCVLVWAGALFSARVSL